MNPEIEAFQLWLNRHLVSLVHIYCHLDDKGNPASELRVTAASGIVMAFGEHWFLVTAGHVLEQLDALIRHPKVKVTKSFLLDDLGSQAKHKNHIPFTYSEDKRGITHNEGLDFGLVELNSNDRQLLEANGIVPVAIENWIHQDIDRCFSFMLVGIPNDWVSHEQIGNDSRIGIGTILASVKRLHEPPDGAEVTKYERFIGDLGEPVDLPSGLEGTSGGPIIGFFRDDKAKLRCWVVALQSSCLKRRYIFGCPVKLFGGILLDELREAVRKMNARQEE